ncbi:MAG: hypothetical protein ABW201_08225 [Candidatus Thiodiazotropha sp.]
MISEAPFHAPMGRCDLIEALLSFMHEIDIVTDDNLGVRIVECPGA